MSYLNSQDPHELSIIELAELQEIHPSCDFKGCTAHERGTYASLRRKWAMDVDGQDFCPQHNPYNIDLEPVRKHYQGLLHELRTEEVHVCDHCNRPFNELPAVIAKAEERLADVPMGEEISFDDLIYGKEAA